MNPMVWFLCTEYTYVGTPRNIYTYLPTYLKRIDAKSVTKDLICIQLLTEAATMTNRNFRDHYYCLLVTCHSSPWTIYFFRGAFSKQGVAL